MNRVVLVRSISGRIGLFCLGLALCINAACLDAKGEEVWDGPLMVFDHPYGSETNVIDYITPNVWITREFTRGLFNAATEADFTDFVSPADTEWSDGLLLNYASLTYQDWENWAQMRPPDTVGKDAVLHLISEDIYLSIKFTLWGGPGGAYTYERSTPPVPEPSAAALLSFAGGLMLLWRSRRS